MKSSKWDLRVARADHLAEQHPFAMQALTFFKEITQLQANLYSEAELVIGKHGPEAVVALREGNLPDRSLSYFPEFLARLEAISPEPLAKSASLIKEGSSEYWRDIFISSWQGARPQSDPIKVSEAALGRLFLQPFAECLADQQIGSTGSQTPGACPFCSEKPIVGVLRPEGDGGKRSLVCSMCATEWHCGRILCPACGEQDVNKLAVYSTDQFPQVRIEACDTCKYYIKTVDLTKTGRAVPVVDELATIPLNLWANDHGYQKLQTNLLGL